MFSPPQNRIAGIDPAERIDLTTCSFGELSYFLAGVMHGAQSQATADDEREDRRWEALHSQAVSVVHAMAKLPERDALADARRAEERAAWWAERRGERRAS